MEIHELKELAFGGESVRVEFKRSTGQRTEAAQTACGMLNGPPWRDCYWLYIVTHYADTPTLQEPVKDPARLKWHEVSKVAHYYLSVNAMTRPMMVREDKTPYRTGDQGRRMVRQSTR